MTLSPLSSGEIALTFLGKNIPAIGPKFKSKEEAVEYAQNCLRLFSWASSGRNRLPVKLVFRKKSSGKYTLILQGGNKTLGRLEDLDEVTSKRLEKGLKNCLFILTPFVEKAGGLECLVLTEGLGAVIYNPGLGNKWCT